MEPKPADNPFLPTEREVITPVQSINGTLLYQRTTGRELIQPVGNRGQHLVCPSGDPLVISVDEKTGKTTTAARTDGVQMHLLRQILKPETEAPSGYYILEATPSKTRHKFIRDGEGRMVGAEVETEAPSGYYILESAAVGTRAKVVRDNDGKLIALETEPASPNKSEPVESNRWGAKQQAGFGVRDAVSDER